MSEYYFTKFTQPGFNLKIKSKVNKNIIPRNKSFLQAIQFQ